ILLGGALVGRRMPATFPTRWQSIQFSRKDGQPFFLQIQLENGNARKISLPKYSPLLDAPTTCTRAEYAGCRECVAPVAGEGAPGKSLSAECTGMLPGAKFDVIFNLRYDVISAQSRRTDEP